MALAGKRKCWDKSFGLYFQRFLQAVSPIKRLLFAVHRVLLARRKSSKNAIIKSKKETTTTTSLPTYTRGGLTNPTAQLTTIKVEPTKTIVLIVQHILGAVH